MISSVSYSNHRHAELVSASIVPCRTKGREAKWTLNQVQGDGVNDVGFGVEIIKEDQLGMRLTLKTISHPSGTTAEIYEVWRNLKGRWPPISNGEAGDIVSAEQRYDAELERLKGSNQ